MPNVNNPNGYGVRDGRIQLLGKKWDDVEKKSIFQPGVALVLEVNSSVGNGNGSFYPEDSRGNTTIFSSKAFNVSSAGLLLPRDPIIGSDGEPTSKTPEKIEGMIYYDTTKKGVKLYNGSDWVDIGSGSGSGVLKPTVILTGNSGSVGMILNKDSNDTSGTNSPMLVFDGFGVRKVGFLEQKNSDIFSSLFRVDKAYAITAPCNTTAENIGEGCGGGGAWLSGYPTPDGLQPIWWMRQQGTSFSVMASDPTLSDLRYSLTLTKGGGVLAGGPNNSVIPGNGQFFEYRKDLKSYIPTAPSGTWCGLNAYEELRWSCGGYDPGNDASPCPIGWKLAKIGEWDTCIKL